MHLSPVYILLPFGICFLPCHPPWSPCNTHSLSSTIVHLPSRRPLQTLPRPSCGALTLALSDGRHLPRGRRVAVDTAVLQNALRLSKVLEGAVDTGGEVRHIPGLQYQLGHPGQEVWVNGVLSPLLPPLPPPPSSLGPSRVATLTGTWDMVTETLRGCTVSCTHCSRSEAKR